MKPTHTRGPWVDMGRGYRDPQSYRLVTGAATDAAGRPYSKVVAMVPEHDIAAPALAEAEANARLVAAAPELLRALRRLADKARWINDEDDDIEAHQSPEWLGLIDDADAAVRRATGE